MQTAEGALTEVHSILQRMRDLAVQAANTGSQDTRRPRPRRRPRSTQLNAEIDRIGNTTTFGEQKLLDGTFGTGRSAVDTAAATATAPAHGCVDAHRSGRRPSPRQRVAVAARHLRDGAAPYADGDRRTRSTPAVSTGRRRLPSWSTATVTVDSRRQRRRRR